MVRPVVLVGRIASFLNSSLPRQVRQGRLVSENHVFVLADRPRKWTELYLYETGFTPKTKKTLGHMAGSSHEFQA